MSAGEKAARDALRESMDTNREQVRLVTESRLLLRDDIRDAVREGITEAMTEENAERFWMKGFEIAQQQAAQRAGLLVLGGLKRILGIAAIVMAIYMLAGAPAAKAVWAALTKA